MGTIPQNEKSWPKNKKKFNNKDNYVLEQDNVSISQTKYLDLVML